ncbi:MAG: M23 family metallopeptidase [Desulfobacteraceae bacterium]|nr:M23 family metallopeptidase [Desulfobacteraceae bacterium]MBC2754492.1 M23 family metallopeptidase [Desulfobacteraceae bacterium]
MREKLTLLIYNEGGSFVRLKLLSKKFLKILSVIGVFCIFLLGFILFDYAYLKYTSYHSRNLKNEVRSLKSELKDRNKQIETFYSRIDALQLKLIKLNQLEQEIRSYTGINNNSQDTGDYGIGGILDISGEQVCTADFYNKFLQNMDDDVDRLDREACDQSEEFQILWETLKEIKAIQQVTPSMRPVEGGWISSKFGFRKSPFSDKHEFHSGVDIAAHKGTPVVATANGTISYAGYKGSLGKTVFINHGFGIVTRYGHLNSFHVNEGQKVKRGDVIGEVGSTGRSTGPHLHYEVRLNDIPVNAEKYMSEYLANKDPS